ncbi:MAG: OmpA family protein [Crocinitomicaceae bacterium]|nr:OmpA family protein [Crocinitomicaceae bacterium]MBK8924322.1 OmpA family protein [Crocinitomicaceae bacterium]
MMNRTYRIVSTLIFTLLLSSTLFAQSKKVWLYKADDAYEKRDYATALRYYHMVLDDTLGMSTQVLPYEITLSNQKIKKDSAQTPNEKTVSITQYVNHQMAMCYRLSQDYANAANYFKISAENSEYQDDYYYYGLMLMYLGDYETAQTVFDKYVSIPGIDENMLKRAFREISGCRYALEVEEPEEKIEVTLSDTVIFNKGTSSFAAMYWGDGYDKIIFTSAREGGVILDPETQDSRYLCDLYWSEKASDGNWDRAHNFGRPLNSARHDASGAIFNNFVYYTRWSDENRKDKHIYLARMIDMKFFESLKLDSTVNMDGFQSINPFVTSDGKWLYFSSNRPGGYGGFDIWRIALDEVGSPTGEAYNVGEPLNSEYDELSPFFHEPSSSLFFSSDGHASMGGLDIFKSNYDPESDFYEMPVNLGIPINSAHDDSYYITDSEMRYGFITSNRSDCAECDSLYTLCSHCYKIYNVLQPPPVFKIKGYVYDEVTEEVIPNARIEFKDVSYQWEHFELVADEKGYYEHELIPNLELFLRASAKGYFADKAVVMTKGQLYSKVYRQDFYLEKIPEGEITIEGIEYDYDSANLRPVSIEILDRLIEFLELNHNLKIEIRSHTDERGSDKYNLDLSNRRAQSVVDYLISQGIPAERLVAKGYGETMPAEVKDESGNVVTLTPDYIYSIPDKDKQEEYHQRNRRTAFFVLEEH